MNSYPISPNQIQKVPPKRIALAAVSLALLTGCQTTASNESPYPEARLCVLPADELRASAISGQYQTDVEQILSSLSHAAKETATVERSHTKTGSYVTDFALRVPGTSGTAIEKDVHVRVESAQKTLVTKNVTAISSYVLGRMADDQRFTYSEQNMTRNKIGWEFTSEHLTRLTQPDDVDSVTFVARSDGYSCGYIEKDTPQGHVESMGYALPGAKNAQAIANVAVASLLRNAGAMEHPTPGFLDSQVLPDVMPDFWQVMQVDTPPLVPVQPMG